MQNTLGLWAVEAAFWASIAFIVVYTAVAKWWHTQIGWARISLDFAMSAVLGPVLLGYYFPHLSGTAITWSTVSGLFLAAAVVAWNAEIVVRTQIKKWLSRHTEPTPRKVMMTAPAPSAPVVTSITFDQTAYSPGETITATVHYTPGTAANTDTFTGSATDSGGAVGTLQVSFTVIEPVPTSANTPTDSAGRTWAKQSDVNGVAVFTATA